MYDIDKIRENLEKEQELSLDWGYCFKDMLEWWDNHQHYPPHLQRILFKDDFGLGFNLDFRIDREVGDRMMGVDKKSQAFINRFREMLKECETYAFGDEECFLMVVNKKALHGRESLNGVDKIGNIARLSSAPRVLLRSKGVAQKCFEALRVGVAV
ncbi:MULTISPECIES: hypothetical protein [Helicobacter]|uniref:hypothetical protein n=1 Tax=Helicobacter TaxID=209 RepID=UPI002604E053|nr:hypothetical protein [Helicobacter sp. UBA3407]